MRLANIENITKYRFLCEKIMLGGYFRNQVREYYLGENSHRMRLLTFI